MFRNTFLIRDNWILPLSQGDQGKGVPPQLWYVLLVHENAAIGFVVLQSEEILWLIICFAIHFLCVTTV